ncbi:MAG: ABC transporter permease [Thermoanaerobaculia bacterium]
MPELDSSPLGWQRFVASRLPPLGLAPERELEVAEELALQLEEIYRRELASGASEAAARARAEAEIGDWAALAAEIRHAEQRLPDLASPPPLPAAFQPSRGAAMDQLWQDLRYALRTALRNRGLSAVIVLTVALGIGATTAIFSLVRGLLLAPLPFPDAGRLVVAMELDPGDGGRMSVSWPSYQDWATRARSLDGIAAFRNQRANWTGGESAARLSVSAVGGSFFGLLGAQPQLGRLIAPGDDTPGAPQVAVVTDRFWRERLGGDPAVLGRTLTLDGQPVPVVGVLPAGFVFSRDRDLYLSLVPAITPADLDRGNHRGLRALGHLRPRVSLEAAGEEMKALARTLAAEHPDTNSGNGAAVFALHDLLVEDVRPALLVLMAAVLAVLAIACVNLANLQLARGATRSGEMGLRLALGAGRRQLVRQLLGESLLLALAGGALGVALAYQALPLLVSWLPDGVPHLPTLRLDGRVLLFATALSLTTGLLFGLLPALAASRSALARSARQSSRGASGAGWRGRSRTALLVAEVALAFVLLATAGLMMRTVLRLVRVDPGLDVPQLLTLQLDLPDERYDEPRRRIAYRQMLERVRALPGVLGAGLTLSLPLDGSNWTSVFLVADHPVPPRAELPSAAFTPISPGFFAAVGGRLVAGRELTEADGPDSPWVALVNQTAAQRLWPGESPLGKRIKQGWPEEKTPWREVVGVVADLKLNGVAAETPMNVFVPLAQEPAPNLHLLVRTAGSPANSLLTVAGALRELDHDVPVTEVRTMNQVLADSIASRRFPMILLAQFSLAALVLAALGIFGLMSYAVARRTHEMGLRMALGASGTRVLTQVLGESLRVVAAGVALGAAGALLASRLLGSLLFQVAPSDPLSFAAATTILLAVALAAAYLPARRAAKVDPMAALRWE